MKLEGDQLVLDTNIFVHWMRGRAAGVKLRADYELGARRPRPIVPVVVKAEIRSLALQFNWAPTSSWRSMNCFDSFRLQTSPPTS